MTITPEKIDAYADAAAQIVAREVFYDPEGRGDFLDYVYIDEPPQAGAASDGGAIKLQKWPHICEIAEQLQRPWIIPKSEITPEDLKTLIGKARQIGASWIVAAYNVWVVWSKDGAVNSLLSQGEIEATELLRKCKFIYEQLPDSWQKPFDKDSNSEWSFAGWHSRMQALASTRRSGRSITGSVVTIDEADHHEYFSENLTAIKPTIDAGGQIIVLSTVDKRKTRSGFQNLYRDALAGTNGWRKLFYSYKVRPGRDDAWYERTRIEAPEDELKGLPRELYMEQEYPRTEEEMLSPPRTISYFDHDSLIGLQQYTREPMLREGGVNIWQKFQAGYKYVAASDVGWGVGADYSVTVILGINTNPMYKDHAIVVADVFGNEYSVDDFTEISMNLLRLYHNPLWAVERNGPGMQVIDKAQQMNYPRWFRHQTVGMLGSEPHRKSEVGWQMNVNNRVKAWSALKPATDDGILIVQRKEGLLQFFDIMDNRDKQRPEARPGTHDDYPTACAIAYSVRNAAVGQSREVVRRPSMI